MIVVVEGRRSRKGDVIQARVFQKFADEIVEPVLMPGQGIEIQPPVPRLFGAHGLARHQRVQQPSDDNEKSKASCRLQPQPRRGESIRMPEQIPGSGLSLGSD